MNKKNFFLLLFSFIFYFVCSFYIFADATSANKSKPDSKTESKTNGAQILKKSDEKLIPGICSYDLSLETIKKGESEGLQTFFGHKGGYDRNVIVVKEPKRMQGSAHLRKDQVIWSYHTTNHRLSKMAYQAVFMGTLLNYGDIMATELSIDYNVDKTEVTADNEYILTLTPKANHEGYGKILVTIDKKSLLPKSRKYYALSGILLKECIIKKIEYASNNKLSYLEMDFFEPLKDRKTTVKFNNIQVKKADDIPEKFFNENFLGQIDK
ncbi:MAG: outer membrane lipoprotein-sorting protein [Oligoflexia bacterium]|nr:outer membrane lipoprotein-sorting protein [Oligoflexia bacterium]